MRAGRSPACKSKWPLLYVFSRASVCRFAAGAPIQFSLACYECNRWDLAIFPSLFLVTFRVVAVPVYLHPYMPRVLSLLSASMIVCRLGCSHMLVGRSHGCDDPMLATVLPIATAPRVDPNASSKELDASVRAQAVGGGPVYHVHNELVRKLSPDVIITQEQCRICAATPEDVNVACRGLPAMQSSRPNRQRSTTCSATS